MARSVLVVDDSPIVRKIMRNFFETLTDWKIAGEASDGSEAIQKAVELKPDLILLDFSMPNMNGIETASVLKNALPDVHIIVFTAFDEHLGSKLSRIVGVDVVVSKSQGLTGLIKAIQGFMATAGLIKTKIEATGQPRQETALE